MTASIPSRPLTESNFGLFHVYWADRSTCGCMFTCYAEAMQHAQENATAQGYPMIVFDMHAEKQITILPAA